MNFYIAYNYPRDIYVCIYPCDAEIKCLFTLNFKH